MINYNILKTSGTSSGILGLMNISGLTSKNDLLYIANGTHIYTIPITSTTLTSGNLTEVLPSSSMLIVGFTYGKNVLYTLKGGSDYYIIEGDNGSSIQLDFTPTGFGFFQNAFLIGQNNILKVISTSGKEIISYTLTHNIVDICSVDQTIYILGDDNNLYIYCNGFKQFAIYSLKDLIFTPSSMCVYNNTLWIGVINKNIDSENNSLASVTDTDLYKITFDLSSVSIKLVYYINTSISTIYQGLKRVWNKISSCFGSGIWVSEATWSDDELWKN